MDDHAGGEEEQRLERTVRHEVEDGRASVSDGQGARHVAELADGRVGEDALDVVLGEGGEARADHRDGGHDGKDGEGSGGGREDGKESGDEVDTGGDHGRRVDQRGDGGGARHRVGQPGVQRELRRLARHTREEQQRHQRRVVEATGRDGAEDPGDPERAGVGGEREQADQKGDIAELGDQERLEGGGARLGRLPVVAHEEVRADAHDLPADQEHHQVAGVDDEQHRGGEEGDESRVRGVARVVAQIARRVDLHTGRDEADEDGDQDREAVEVQREVDGDRTRGRELGRGVDRLAPALAHGDHHGERESGQGGQDREGPDEAGGGAAEQQSGRRAEKGEKRDEDGEGRGRHAVASAFCAEAVASGSSELPSWPSAVSRSLSTSEDPRLR